MEWLIFAFAALFASTSNTICNKLGAGKSNAFVVSLVKLVFLFTWSLVMLGIRNQYGHLSSFDLTQNIFMILACVTYTLHTYTYFVAISKANLDGFASFFDGIYIFASNLLFLCFTYTEVINQGHTWSLVLYIIGLLCLILAPILIYFNKEINKDINKGWMVWSVISAILLGLNAFFIKMGLGGVDASITCFYQMGFALVFFFIILLTRRKLGLVKTIGKKQGFFILLSSICAFATTFCTASAHTAPNTKSSLVTLIISTKFIFVFVLYCINKKKNIPWILWPVSFLIIGGIAIQIFAHMI